MPEFVSLAAMLLPPAVVAPPQADLAEACPPQAEVTPAAPSSPVVDEDYLREVRFFKAHLREALQTAVDALLAEIAQTVIARELQVAPADISAIVQHALARYESLEPLRVRVHSDDVAALFSCDVSVFVDDALQRGDAFLDLRSGSIDLSLKTRVDCVIREARS